MLGLLDKSNVVRKRKSSESVETSQILGSSVNYAREGGEGKMNEFSEFGDFVDGDGGMIDGEIEDASPPYIEMDEKREEIEEM